jgi:hypothetical protein
MHDCIMWQPGYGSYYNEYRHDAIGLAFYPLLQFDHRYVHKTHAVYDDDYPKWVGSLAARDIHPQYRGAYMRLMERKAQYMPALDAAYARGDTNEARRIHKLIQEGSDHQPAKTSATVTDLDEQKAQSYIDTLLRVGDTTTNLIARYGPPDYQFETEDRELALCLHLPHSREAAAAGVGGFVGYFVTNRLVRWQPIYQR